MSETFDDGPAHFTAVCELGFEGVVAKNHSSLYRPNDRGWVKVKNPSCWRRDAEREAMKSSPRTWCNSSASSGAQAGVSSRTSSCSFSSFSRSRTVSREWALR